MNRIPKLAGLAEVAGLAGVSRKRAWQLTQHKDFPEPVQPLAATPVWLESDVLAFIAAPRAGGRPATTRRPDPVAAARTPERPEPEPCTHPKAARDPKNPGRCRCGAVNLPPLTREK